MFYTMTLTHRSAGNQYFLPIIRKREGRIYEWLTLYGILLAVLPQAHHNEGQEDEDHHTEHAADDQVQHVTASGRAASRPYISSAP